MKPVVSEKESVHWLDLLPALTLLIVFALFSVQAVTAQSTVTAAHSGSAQPGSAPALRQALPPTDDKAALPVLGQLSPFQLTERDGSGFDLKRMHNQIWVADFIFTSCQAECPLMNLEMQKIQQAFAKQERVELVSFSVDPETDTPERLQAYAKQFQAGPRWSFVTGAKDELYRVASHDFMLAVQDLRPQDHGKHDKHAHHAAKPGAATPQPFLHSQTFALVDGSGQIRGFYDSTDPAAVQQLIQKDLPRLLADG